MVKKHGKKAIKWEGLANYGDQGRDHHGLGGQQHARPTDMLARGYTTITCPWNLGVPWEEWNMYVCNGSRLKKGDSVLGATLVAWEQPPLTHITNLRNLRQPPGTHLGARQHGDGRRGSPRGSSRSTPWPAS